ncbi:hypothetical protein PHYSODRAFT_259951 [Phytophthora sojae]|uniref:endo-polygalacturonase n=1 Tax=Phytophthora sojae (strain P6497) TaxID=1094619 RepID=G4ZLU3_PHYSP|nr:hypothetical protein PHYSODRAFT_259951 [Phytophthora sojae]EGZ15278.1 hypothetical protein PHYSODRAFT_259951 [Phytophthora sojae]|eukprot:XP_009529027.1 hypothetical protein PHYSODRAFT_259951 [Phytophthora sojae]
MKLFTTALATFGLIASTASATPMMRQEAEGGDPCNLTGTYKAGTDISSCNTVTVGPLTVPAGVTLDLSKTKAGAAINFTGTTTFGTAKWEGPLVRVSGNSLTVKGSGTLDGQDTTVSGLTLDSSAGNGLAKNTDGFGLTKSDHITITGNKIYNQDDCLAMQSSTNTFFTNNYCSGSHGISIGSLGGNAVDESTTVAGLTVEGNTIVNSDNGLRIKTVIGLKGLVSNVKYLNNKLQNVESAIAIHSDYSRSKGSYSGAPTSQVTITDITVNGVGCQGCLQGKD